MKYEIDLEKVYRERIKPELTPKEASAMEKALCQTLKDCGNNGEKTCGRPKSL